jgi:serine protease AprX
MIFFTDKSNSTFSISNPSQFLSQKSISRRNRLSITITNEDLPVNASYVQQVKSTGAKTYHTTKWWNGVLVEANTASLSLIGNLAFVKKIELVAPGTKLLGGRVRTVNEKTESSLEATDFQLTQLGLDKMQTENYLGTGVDIAQFDSGWKGVNTVAPFANLFTDARLKDQWNYVRNSSDVFTDDSHGTEVLSTMAATIPSVFSGGIPNANFYLYQTEDRFEEYRVEEYNWLFAAERADSIGIDVINSSLGYNQFDDPSMDYTKANLDGNTAVVSKAARKAMDKGIVVVTSAGNEGNKSWNIITAPADVEGILSVGAVSTEGLRSSFSSVGPTADGRTKPDVVALGSATSTISEFGNLKSNSGTSLSSPLVACLAAGLIQAFPNATPSEIYKAIIASGDRYLKPDNSYGYGIPSFTKAKSYLSYGYLEDEISIFPNPVTNSTVTILIKEPVGQLISATVYDYFGNKLLNNKSISDWKENPIKLDLSSIPNGLYVLEVASGKRIVTKKICKVN